MTASDKESQVSQGCFLGGNRREKDQTKNNSFSTNSDNDDGIYRHSSHLPYVAADLKLLEAALAKVACCHGCGSKIYLEQDLDQNQSILAHLNLYCGQGNFTLVLLKNSISLLIQPFVLQSSFCLLFFSIINVLQNVLSWYTL